MGKLHETSLQTGRHITVLLHEAVSIMYDLTRSDMQKLLALREQTGLSIRELLSQVIAHLWDGCGSDSVDVPPRTQDDACSRAK